MAAIIGVFKALLTILLFLVILMTVIICIIRWINAKKYKITSNNGIQKSEYVAIGSIGQYIQIRGEDLNNPIILILHGGPGSNMAYYSYYWQTDLEKHYTIVHWDQRGSGSTYYYNEKKAEVPSLELLLSDLNELVDHLRIKYNKDNIILMGHSWGTVLGAIYAGKHPEKISHYVSVGQVVDIWRAEGRCADEALLHAEIHNNDYLAREIEILFKQVCNKKDIDVMQFMSYKATISKYLPKSDSLSLTSMIAMSVFSPYLTFNDFKWFLLSLFNHQSYVKVNINIYEKLLSGNGLSLYDYTTEFKTPITFIIGDCDWVTPYILVEEYFNKISAPEKELTYIKNTGHTPFLDKKQNFCDVLLANLAID